jgi:hypothetical protein
MVKRLSSIAFAFVSFVACYSGYSANEPFPCAADGTCPPGILCRNGSCVCPLSCTGGCVDDATDSNNCGACGAICASTCVDKACVNECALFSNDCGGGATCRVFINGASVAIDATLWATACSTIGAAQAGDPCGGNVHCGPNMLCLSTNQSAYTCHPLCDDSHPCLNGKFCETNVNIPNGGGICPD